MEDRPALKRFLLLPAALHAGDPNWVQPLMFERLEHLNPRKNPWFDHAEVGYWLAFRGERPVGRISAQINHLHLERTTMPRVISAFSTPRTTPRCSTLCRSRRRAGCKARGMRRVTGPFSLSINDESGLLVEGFETPPYMMMGHAPRYYAPSGRGAGLSDRQGPDRLRADALTAPSPRAKRMLDRLGQDASLSIRPLDMRRFDDELRLIVDIFNDAWADNWGFVPLAPAEVGYMGKNLTPICALNSPGSARSRDGRKAWR